MTAAQHTRIFVNVRPGWHQSTPLPLDSPELIDRMESQAWHALTSIETPITIEVVAINGDSWRSLRLERPVAVVRTGVTRSPAPAWV